MDAEAQVYLEWLETKHMPEVAAKVDNWMSDFEVEVAPIEAFRSRRLRRIMKRVCTWTLLLIIGLALTLAAVSALAWFYNLLALKAITVF